METELGLFEIVGEEILGGLILAKNQIASERLSGNIVKEEYWKGEMAAYKRIQNVILQNK